MEDKVPNPGSKEANILGCTCPIMDNGHGNGYRPDPDGPGMLFVYSVGCPLHNAKEKSHGA